MTRTDDTDDEDDERRTARTISIEHLMSRIGIPPGSDLHVLEIDADDGLQVEYTEPPGRARSGRSVR